MPIIWSAPALDDLKNLFDWIMDATDYGTALAYTLGIEAACDRLRSFPQSGRPRGDVRPGLRTFPYRRRTLIAYEFQNQCVTIVSVMPGGRDMKRSITGS